MANREKDGCLNIENIKDFPSEDLQMIDWLWVNYSDGKFGFSVQKKLWLECGGKIGEYDQGVWREFAARVGWYYPENDDWQTYNNNWRTYSEFTKDTDNFQNLLPASLPWRKLIGGIERIGRRILVSGVVICSLFSRSDL
ncbi:GUN4 domain-containing protein [Pseudanabaena sp. UWO311]|uniref:GUN4 domain-containing protein n=1 Tax=Pseudanabaena sp. UWO311 TaxID=2487337 RepID=UPI00115B59DB|nr:GUN4 domain-containing protein [Pseudanabaena sp. UWO311]TYQ29321.1 GUN4 domain-containing protein [Pseudanabaena sp. UWO311]